MLHAWGFLLFVLVLFSPLKKASAQTPVQWWLGYAECRLAAEKGTICAEVNQAGAMISQMNGLNEALVGAIPCATVPCNFNIADAENRAYVDRMNNSSTLGALNNAIAALVINQPASFAFWWDDTAQTLGFTPKRAYAQGIGFSGLAPLLPLWKAFRNVAYLLLALFIIIIGFMVMFRKKIDPKTVVTVQNALPRIVLTLILITFSYAIVGILIDLMYLLILLGISIIGSSGIKGIDVPTLQANYLNGGFGTLLQGVFNPLGVFKNTGLAGGAGAILGGLLIGGKSPIGHIVGAILGSVLAGGVAGSATGQGAAVGAMAAILALIFALALLFTFVRVFFILLNAYIQIIISVLLGPFQILMDAIPGVNGFSSWFRNLLYNLMVFPIVVILLLIGTSITANIEGSSFWTAPLIGTGSAQFIKALIGLGIVILIPSIVNGAKEALKIKPGLPIGAGSMFEPVTTTYNTAMQGLSQMYYFQMLRHEFSPMIASLFGKNK